MWLLVVNPKAGKGKSNYLSSKLEDLLTSKKLPYEVINNSTFNETLFDFQQKIKSGNFKNVVAIGGDGLVNLCLQEIAESDIALAVVPAGTGNDFARAVGAYKKSVEEIFNAIRSQDPTAIDLGLVTGDFGRRWYVQVLSTGFDALVNNLANKITCQKGKLNIP